jgi:hypothetical protein
MRKRWKVWVIGIALVLLLALGAGLALLWPVADTSESERAASRIRVGMSFDEAEKRIGPSLSWVFCTDAGWHRHGRFPDGSWISIHTDLIDRVESFRATPPAAPAHPLTRLRRMLGRLVPVWEG